MPSKFSSLLLSWYKANARDLPWRSTKDPYKIWLSEIILQQTRVDQGLPYFFRFIEKFPTVFDLANASEGEVMKCWQGLGYYSRARNLHHTARLIANDGGIFPASFDKLIGLKGIGSYTAAAIASFAFNEPVPVVDGNVYRFISRLFGITIPTGTATSHRYFTSVLMDLMPMDSPAPFNQALMEFGALQCVSGIPNCEICPFVQECIAYQSNEIQSFPVKQKAAKVKEVYFHFVDLSLGQSTWLEQRKAKGIWSQLWHFPLFEWTSDLTELDGLPLIAEFLNLPIEGLQLKGTWNTIHLLSHRKIHARFWKLETVIAPKKNDIFEIDYQAIDTYPLPQIMVKYLTK
jgi:A/G-specific adenine glycosylase